MKKTLTDPPILVVISGPSGVGKDATLSCMKKSGAKFHYVVTATTRPQRKTEIDGVDYYFISQQEFKQQIDKNGFLEYAEVYGNYYGVLKSEVQQALKKGEDVILKVDVQGAATLRKIIPNAVYIFLLPSSIDDLKERLKGRNADSESAINIRLSKAQDELEQVSFFDYKIINYKNNVNETAEIIKAIVIAEKSRVKRPQLII